MPGMEITNSFAVKAEPDRVYEFLLDVNNVVSCVPGAELSEVVDPNTFKGKVRIKVGPVTVSYNGTARITSRDAATRSATLEAEGRETTGSGSAQAKTVMSVAADGDASMVTLATDFTVVGRVAQFGRGIMEDVSRHLVGQAADCIQSKLEAPPASAAPAPGESAVANGTTTATAAAPTESTPSEPAALDAFAIGRAVAKERLNRLNVSPKMIGIAFGGLVSLLLLRRMRRSRRRRRAANG
jgi:carbon monoxide dehydrogenase subunit G